MTYDTANMARICTTAIILICGASLHAAKPASPPQTPRNPVAITNDLPPVKPDDMERIPSKGDEPQTLTSTFEASGRGTYAASGGAADSSFYYLLKVVATSKVESKEQFDSGRIRVEEIRKFDDAIEILKPAVVNLRIDLSTLPLDQIEATGYLLGGVVSLFSPTLGIRVSTAVAFVVTASDRLTSDLATFREDFEAYASEVTNHLTNPGLDWKRFDATVSGQLDDQNKPKLARGENNTTHEPFLWLLKRIRDSKRRKCILAAAAVLATFLGVSGAVFGGLVAHSRRVLTRAEGFFCQHNERT